MKQEHNGKPKGFGGVIADPVSDYRVREVFRDWHYSAEVAEINMLGI